MHVRMFARPEEIELPNAELIDWFELNTCCCDNDRCRLLLQTRFKRCFHGQQEWITLTFSLHGMDFNSSDKVKVCRLINPPQWPPLYGDYVVRAIHLFSFTSRHVRNIFRKLLTQCWTLKFQWTPQFTSVGCLIKQQQQKPEVSAETFARILYKLCAANSQLKHI